MSSCEKKLNGYVNLKRTVGYQSTIIGEFACYILACLSSCLITEWLQLPHEATSSCHRVSVYCTVSCFAGSVFTSMHSSDSCMCATWPRQRGFCAITDFTWNSSWFITGFRPIRNFDYFRTFHIIDPRWISHFKGYRVRINIFPYWNFVWLDKKIPIKCNWNQSFLIKNPLF